MAAAAYRAGVVLTDDRTGLVHDYTRRDGVVSAEVILPGGATTDRAALWNAAEAAERRKDSRTAREWVVALPDELDAPQRAALARAFAVELVERYGVAVDVAIHRPDRQGDQRNHHAHLLTTTRTVSLNPETGRVELGGKSAIELGDRDRAKAGIAGRSADDITELRARWAELANAALEHAGCNERIDHRSLAAQGVERAPTQHLGPVANDMERNGHASDRGDANRQTAADNGERVRLVAQVIDLRAERERRATAQRATAMPAEELVARWDKTQGEMIVAIHRKADDLARRIADKIEAIRKQREKARAEHERRRPVEPHGMLAGFKRKGYERAKGAWTETARRIVAWKAKRESDLVHRLQRIEGYLSRLSVAVGDRATGRARRILTRMWPAYAERLPQAREQVKREREERKEREQQVKAFKDLARKREQKVYGYGDTGTAWTSLSPALRKVIEGYNASDAAGRAKGLDALRAADGQTFLATVLPKQEQVRSQRR